MPIFFNERDGPWYPTLRLVHKCEFNPSLLEKPASTVMWWADPTILPVVRIDKGAIKFVLAGY
jgi:PUA domain protein